MGALTRVSFLAVALTLSAPVFATTYECAFREEKGTDYSLIKEIGRGVLSDVGSNKWLKFETDEQITASVKLYKLGASVPDTFGVSGQLRLMMGIFSPNGREEIVFAVDDKKYATPSHSLHFDGRRFAVRCR